MSTSERQPSSVRLGVEFGPPLADRSMAVAAVDVAGSVAAAGGRAEDIWLTIDGEPASQVLAGWADGSRPRIPDIPISIAVRRGDERLVIRPCWRVCDGAAARVRADTALNESPAAGEAAGPATTPATTEPAWGEAPPSSASEDALREFLAHQRERAPRMCTTPYEPFHDLDLIGQQNRHAANYYDPFHDLDRSAR